MARKGSRVAMMGLRVTYGDSSQGSVEDQETVGDSWLCRTLENKFFIGYLLIIFPEDWDLDWLPRHPLSLFNL